MLTLIALVLVILTAIIVIWSSVRLRDAIMREELDR